LRPLELKVSWRAATFARTCRQSPSAQSSYSSTRS
jgi:hypothetical protein